MNSLPQPTPADSAPAVVLRALIADDEPAARRRLRKQLAAFTDIEIVGECGDGAEFAEVVKRTRPDLALLDIQMPGTDGLTAIRNCALEERPVVIFVTAFEQHALEAFDVQAADYLLKPISRARLATALNRARVLCQSRATVSRQGASVEKVSRLNRLVVPTGERMLVVQSSSIDWIESAGNYAVIHVGSDTHVLRETLLELEARLAQGQFLRISRTTLVNLDRVRELRSDASGGHVMLLADGTKLGITRGIREVQKRLETS
jgi:two-component system, LytTR family, response regulator